MRALVVGGGIGGLAAAIALRRVGLDVTVFEQAHEFERVGYGFGLSPNALLALERLHLAEAVRMRGARAERVLIRRWDGELINEVRVGELGWEMLGVHRADLQLVLQEAAGDTLRLDSRCDGFAEEASGAKVMLADGSEERGDLLVGADGINSAIRKQLHGAGELRYAGHVAWRAAIAFEDERLRGTMTESWGSGARFGLVPIGHGRLYWFVAERGPPNAAPAPGGAKAALLRRFADWHEPIRAVIEATDEAVISKTDVYDRKPLASWGRGHVTLLGDAAHPMTPNLGQGAAQALEDAVVLANRLRATSDAEAALRAYEAKRIPRTAEIVRRSWQLGRIAQVQSPLGRRVRDLLFRATPQRIQRAQQERVIRVDLD
jgi:2-polyprenyl-6-methoxyphenol hydroxylase-like FAD-dependent oxidoreductase